MLVLATASLFSPVFKTVRQSFNLLDKSGCFEASLYSRSDWQWASFMRKLLAVILKSIQIHCCNNLTLGVHIAYLEGLAMEQVFTTNWVFRQSSAPVQMGL